MQIYVDTCRRRVSVSMRDRGRAVAVRVRSVVVRVLDGHDGGGRAVVRIGSLMDGLGERLYLREVWSIRFGNRIEFYILQYKVTSLQRSECKTNSELLHKMF